MNQEAIDKALANLTEAIASLRPVTEINLLYAEYALARKGNNKVQAAKAIRIDRRTLQRWEKNGEVKRIGTRFAPLEPRELGA